MATTITGLRLLPAAPGLCPICATKHTGHEAHNALSIFYQMRFWGAHHRWPTWADAVAHLNREAASDWQKALSARGIWTAPPDGTHAIAEPLTTDQGKK